MRRRLTQRLLELEADLESVQLELSAVERRADDTRATMLRISGAIAVLDEALTSAVDEPESELVAQTERKVDDLRQEMERGRGLLDDLERQRAQLYDSMLQTAGAVRALRELLGADGAEGLTGSAVDEHDHSEDLSPNSGLH